MKRPLVVSAAALIWGIILSDVNSSHGWGFVSVALSIVAMILLYRPKKSDVSRFIFLAIPFLLTGYFIHNLNITHHIEVFKPWDGQTSVASGRVYDEPVFLEGKTSFVLDVRTIENGKESSKISKGYIKVNIYSEDPVSNIQYGSVVKVSGELKLPQGKRNIGGFDTRKYLAAREISGIMSISQRSLTVLEGTEASWLKSTGYKLRHSIIQAIGKCLPPSESSLLAGMLIGYTDEMPEEMEESFRRAGISHVLAVSGANIAFLLVPLLWVLERIGINRKWSSVIAFPMMVFFVFATGMEASVVRAAIMAGVTLTGMLFWRRTDIYCSLAASAIIILLKNSYMLYDMGFILSFSATVSLAMFTKPIIEKIPIRIPKGVRETLAATISAQLGVIPVIAYNFNTFSLVSVVTNLLIVPMTGLITVLGAVTAILGNLVLPIGKLIGIITKIIIDVMLFITESIAKISWAEIGIATPGLLLVILYYVLLLYLRYGHPRLPKDAGRPVLAGILLLFGTILVFMSIPNHTLRIYFADVGQGDCILIRTPQNKNIIIDGGGSINDEEGSYAGENIVVPLLYDFNMTEIDLMIATHGHADHIGGLKSVLEKLKVKELVFADAPDAEMQELTEYAQKKGVSLSKAAEGAVLFDEEDLTIRALYPLQETSVMTRSATTNANEFSLVTLLDYGSFNAVFTGDIGSETEKRIVDDGTLPGCDLLKVAHHGSKYSSSESFLAAVNPGLSVISVGRNKYGHPGLETLDRLKQQGTQVYQTMESGGILVEVNKDDTRMRITTVQ